MEIKQFKENGKGHFKALESGKEVGILDYSLDGKNTIILHHTEVNPEFEGKGIGKKLIMESVTYARNEDLKILPRCSYAQKVFERTTEIQDVLYKSRL